MPTTILPQRLDNTKDFSSLVPSAYARANNSLSANTGGTVTGNVTVTQFTTLTGLRETRITIAASDISLISGTYFTKTVTGPLTLTVSDVAAANSTSAFVLELTNGGSSTVTWWSGVTWAGGTAPTLTSAGVDVLGFYTHNGGSTWRGFLLAKDIK